MAQIKRRQPESSKHKSTNKKVKLSNDENSNEVVDNTRKELRVTSI